MDLPFIDLAAQQARIRDDVDKRIAAVLNHGTYILGPEVKELEAALAERCGATHVISCSSGTDALILALLGLGLRPGQGVIVPSFTFAASAEAMAVLGSLPVFAEVDAATYNLDADGLPAALAAANAQNIEVVGIMCVGLFGQPADITRISAFADTHGLWVLDDATFPTSYIQYQLAISVSERDLLRRVLSNARTISPSSNWLPPAEPRASTLPSLTSSQPVHPPMRGFTTPPSAPKLPCPSVVPPCSFGHGLVLSQAVLSRLLLCLRLFLHPIALNFPLAFFLGKSLA